MYNDQQGTSVGHHQRCLENSRAFGKMDDRKEQEVGELAQNLLAITHACDNVMWGQSLCASKFF